MFDKIAEKLQQLANEAQERISQFEDEIAEKTDWRPLNRGGQNYGSHTLQQISPNRVEFKSTVVAKLFCSLFIAAGMYLAYLGFSTITVPLEQIFETSEWLPIIGGLVFFGIGSVFLKKLLKPIVFDKEKQMFWKGKKNPQPYSSEKNLNKKIAPLREIHALQILSEGIGGGSGGRSRRSYELNLVFKDATRLNVVDHGNKSQLKEDAITLASFLGVPIWDISR